MNTTLAIATLKLKPSQIDAFRHACIKLSGDPDLLFSNEEKQPNGKMRHLTRYPAIQYRCLEGRAALWGINQGADALQRFLKKTKNHFEMHEVPTEIAWNIEHHHNIEPQLARGKKMYYYRIYQWLPFNKEENYQWWLQNKNTISDIEKTKKLESILWGHLNNFITEVAGWKKERAAKINCFMVQKSLSFVVQHNHTGFTAFDITFATNINLPLGIGLGALKSHGYGIVVAVL